YRRLASRVWTAYRLQAFRSQASLARASATVCHCMFETASGPPQTRGTMWSFRYPGQGPLVSPFEGQGCSRWNSLATACDRCSLAEATTGEASAAIRTNQVSRRGLAATSGLALSKDTLGLADMRVYGDEERH